MALNNDRFPSIEETNPGGGTTNAYNAKNRNGSDSGKVVDPSKFLYKNFPNGSGSFTLSDIDMYPFVKINEKYYVNDGNKWEYTDGNKTASLMPITNAYLHNKTPYWAEIGRFMQSRRQTVYYKEDSEIINTGESIISNKEIKWPWNSYYIPGYGINSIAINGVGYNAGYATKDSEKLFKFDKVLFNFQEESNFNPQKYNFVNNYIEKYKWIYQDFNYEWGESNKPRSGYEKIGLRYNKTDKTLTISGVNAEENTILESVPFDDSKDKCLIYYRYPKDINTENDVTNIFPTIGYTYEASAVHSIIKATLRTPFDKYQIKLNNIEANVINLTTYSQYDFYPNTFFANGYDYPYNVDTTYMDIIKIENPESEIDIIAKSFIKKYNTSIDIDEQNSFSFKLEDYVHKSGDDVVVAWYTPYRLNFKFYINNFQYLLDYEDTKINDFTGILKCHKDQKYDKVRVYGLYVILKTYLTYYYSLNKQYNGLFNYGKKRINYDTTLEISTGDDYLARYDWEQFFNDSTNILRSATHEVRDNVGLKFSGPSEEKNAPVAIALLVLWGNERVIVSEENNDDSVDTGGSSGTENGNTGGGGENFDGPGTPTPNPEVTPIQ